MADAEILETIVVRDIVSVSVSVSVSYCLYVEAEALTNAVIHGGKNRSCALARVKLSAPAHRFAMILALKYE